MEKHWHSRHHYSWHDAIICYENAACALLALGQPAPRGNPDGSACVDGVTESRVTTCQSHLEAAENHVHNTTLIWSEAQGGVNALCRKESTSHICSSFGPTYTRVEFVRECFVWKEHGVHTRWLWNSWQEINFLISYGFRR